MNRSQMIDLFQMSCKNYSTNAYPPNLVAHWLDEAQIDIVLRTRCYTSTKTLTSVDGTREYNAGTDILQILHMMYNDLEIQPASFEQIQLLNGYPSEGEGTPTVYYIRMSDNPVIGFSPIPDTSSLDIDIIYVKRPPDLTNTANNPVIPEQYHRLIVEGALYHNLVKDVKFEVAERWKMDYERRVERMAAEIRGLLRPKQLRMAPYDVENRNKHLKYATEA